MHTSTQIPIILVRPLLATSNDLINCKNGVIKLYFGNMTLELNIFNIAEQPEEKEDMYKVNYIELLMQNLFDNAFVENKLETRAYDELFKSMIDTDSITTSESFVNMSFVGTWVPKFKELSSSGTKSILSNVTSPKPELKPLPTDLKYVF